jgi:hypothetical protein
LGVPVERDDVLASMNGDRGELGSKPVEFGLERLPTRPVDRQVISPIAIIGGSGYSTPTNRRCSPTVPT